MSSSRNEECKIIRDILPSYVDGLTSDVSNEIIEAHIEGCEECRAELERMRKERDEDIEKIRREEKAYLRHINRKERRPYINAAILVLIALLLIYLFVPGTFGDKRLSAAQKDALMEAYTNLDELYYDEYFPSKRFAVCHIYGAENKGDELLVYANILYQELVRVGNKAYDMSGGRMPCVIHARAQADEMHITDVEYPEDGIYYVSSLRELFPLRYYLRLSVMGEEGAANSLKADITKKIKEEWGGEVSDDLLDIDEEAGTYTITRVDEGIDESGEYYFDTEIIEEGKL